jgi:hypothetical protein
MFFNLHRAFEGRLNKKQGFFQRNQIPKKGWTGKAAKIKREAIDTLARAVMCHTYKFRADRPHPFLRQPAGR